MMLFVSQAPDSSWSMKSSSLPPANKMCWILGPSRPEFGNVVSEKI